MHGVSSATVVVQIPEVESLVKRLDALEKILSEASLLGDEILKLPEAARLLRMSPDAVRGLATSGQIPAFKNGHAWRFSRRALLEWAYQRAQDNLDYRKAVRRWREEEQP